MITYKVEYLFPWSISDFPQRGNSICFDHCQVASRHRTFANQTNHANL